MTTDHPVPVPTRDVRLTLAEIELARDAVRVERRKHDKAIEKALAARAAGNTIQHGTLDWHVDAAAVARILVTTLDVAATALRRQERSTT